MRYGEPWLQERKRYEAPQGKEWVDWFAWYPVRIGEPIADIGKHAWLETVQWRYWDGMTYNLPTYRFKP